MMIDYVDFVILDGQEYIRGASALARADVGERVGVVRCRIEGSGASADYRPVDGDAAFLPPGTPLFAVRARPMTSAIAALRSGRYIIYVVGGHPD